MLWSMITATASRQATPLRSHWHPDLLANLVRSNRLTLLYGAPGPPRDAMLRRGLMPMLGHAGAKERALRFDAWGPLPLHALRAHIDKVLPMPWSAAPPATLGEHLVAACAHHQAHLLLVLDAFESHLAEPAERADIARFDAELAQCVTQRLVPVHVLLVADDAGHPALRRYAQWIPDFGREWLRLSNEAASDDWLWSDTDIDASLPEPAVAMAGESNVRDDAAAPDEADLPLDLSLDEPRASARPSASPSARAPAHSDASRGDGPGSSAWSNWLRAPVRETTPSETGAASSATSHVAPPHVAPPHVTPPHVAPPHVAPPHVTPPHVTPPHVAPPHVAQPRVAPPHVAPSHAAPPHVAPQHYGLGAAFDGPTLGSALGDVPSWHPEPDAFTLRRTQKPARWWRGSGRLLVNFIALGAAAWLIGSWILGEDLPSLLRNISDSVMTRQDAPRAPSAPAATDTAAATTPTPNTTTQGTPVSNADAAAAAAPPPNDTQRRSLTVALPPEAGSAAPVVEELARTVAAPAGIPLNLATSGDSAALAVWRHDALLAARGPNAPPLRVVAPLFNEQIQVIVRVDAPWDYVHQIRSLRINVGRADGARARTARVLYRQLFGIPLPAVAINELSEAQALQQLLRRNGPIDAVIVVSEAPVLAQVPAAWRGELRELVLDPNDRRVGSALQTYAISRRSASEKPRLGVMNYLVAPGPTPHSHEATLRALTLALCRAQPTLQERGSVLLRGLAQGQQPAVGWPYVVPRANGVTCPGEAPLADTRRSDAPALETAQAKGRAS